VKVIGPGVRTGESEEKTETGLEERKERQTGARAQVSTPRNPVGCLGKSRPTKRKRKFKGGKESERNKVKVAKEEGTREGEAWNEVERVRMAVWKEDGF